MADVEVLVPAQNATRRIIHIRDWHTVPRELFALDIRQATGLPLTELEVDERYAAFLQDVDAVQREQEQILAALAARHGLKRVLQEGLTREGLQNYKAIMAAQKATADRLAKLQADAAALGPAPDVHAQVEKLAASHRRESLPFGALGRFVGRGVLEAVPLDELHEFEKAKPIQPDGTIRYDPIPNEARHDVNITRAMASGPWSVLVMGGSHDLTGAVLRWGDGTTEYVRVSPKRYAEAAGGK